MKCPACSKWINPVKAFELSLGNKKYCCPNCSSISERDRVRDSVNVGLTMLSLGFVKLRHIDFVGYLDLSHIIVAVGVFIVLDNVFGRLILISKSSTI